MTTDDCLSAPAARLDHHRGEVGLVVEGLRVTDAEVLREAAHWSTGVRGPAADLADLAGCVDADLSAFVVEALSVGSRVLAITAQSSESLAFEQAVKAASEQATVVLDRAAKTADEAVRRAADQITTTTRQAHADLMGQVTNLVGGENPELLERLRPILAGVGQSLEKQVLDSMSAASNGWAEASERRHTELAGLIREVQREVAVRVAADSAAADATAAARGASTLKGLDYEEQLHPILADIAAGLGDEYEITGDRAGALSRNKKGDGVFHLFDPRSGRAVSRVVIEAHDGTSKQWGSYLAEAERNRAAAASIGLVRHLDDNAGHAVRVIGSKRLVLAFDPETADERDHALLRTAVQLVRTVALTSTGRFGTAAAETANECIHEALEAVKGLDEVKRAASHIRTNADKVDSLTTAAITAIQTQLHQALTALGGALDESGAEPDQHPDPADAEGSEGLVIPLTEGRSA